MTESVHDRITFIMSPGAFRVLNHSVSEVMHPDGFAALAAEEPSQALRALETGPKSEVELATVKNPGEQPTDQNQTLDVELIVKQSLFDRLRRRKIGAYICFSVNSTEHIA